MPTVSEQERIHRSTKRVVSEESQEYQKGSLKSSRKRGYDLKTGALTKSKREQWDHEKRTRIFQGLEKFDPKTHKKVFQDEKYWDSASGFLTLRAKSIYNSHGELTFWEQEVHNPDDGMLVSRETERCDPQTGEAVRDRIEYVKIDEETVAAAVEVHKISVGDELTYCRRRELDPQTGKEVKKEVRRGKNFAETTEINPENGTGYCRRENLEPNAGQAVSITDHFKGGKRTERFAVFPENEPSLTA